MDIARQSDRRRMGRRRGACRQHQPVQHQRGRRRSMPAPPPTTRKRAIAAAKAAFPAWSRSGILERHAILSKAADEILARKDELGALLSREEGKTLPEGIGEVDPRRPDLRLLRRRGAAPGRRDRAVGASGRRRRDHPRADRRRRHHHAVEFPDRHPGLEDRAGALLRQHRGVQAGRPGAGLLLGDRRHPAPRRPAQGRAQPRHGQGLGRRPGDARQPGRRRASPSPARSAPASASPRPAIEHMRKFQLEMGGKNPIVVLDDADLKVAVETAAQTAPSSRPASAARPRRASSSPKASTTRSSRR